MSQFQFDPRIDTEPEPGDVVIMGLGTPRIAYMLVIMTRHAHPHDKRRDRGVLVIGLYETGTACSEFELADSTDYYFAHNDRPVAKTYRTIAEYYSYSIKDVVIFRVDDKSQ